FHAGTFRFNTSCAGTPSTITVTVHPTPSATISYAGSPYCSSAGTATATVTGTTGGTFSSAAGLSINASTGAVNLGASTPGSYTVTYTIPASNGCSAFSTTASITVTGAPWATGSYPSNPYCTNGGFAIPTGSSSGNGTLSASPAGLSINSTNGVVTLGTSLPGTYTVTYTVPASGGCPVYTQTSSITVTAAPSATIAYTGSPYCTVCGTATVTQTGTTGGTYSSTTGLSINATTGAITLATSTPGTYTVSYTIPAANGCAQFIATTSVTVAKVNPIYVSNTGSDVTGNGMPGNPYQTIVKAVTAADNGDTVRLFAGTFNELVTINKSITMDGQNPAQGIVNYTGTIDYSTNTTLPTLFKVTAQNVTIKNIGFRVNQNIVHSAIHTSGNASGLQVLNNVITATATAAIPTVAPASTALAYARRNAVAINPSIAYGGTQYTQYGAGITNVKCSGNTIWGTTTAQNGFLDADFRAGFAMDVTADVLVGGTVAEKNIIRTINHDVHVRTAVSGAITIRNNDLRGGGVEFSAPTGSVGTFTVDSNTFDYQPAGAPNFSLLRLMNNSGNRTTVVKHNTFTNHNRYISIENYRSLTVDGNTFTPVIKVPGVAVSNQFRHILVHTRTLQSSSPTKVTIEATFINNVFNGLAGVEGKGVGFYNHDNTGVLYGTYVMGQTGAENIFNANISNYIYIDNSNGVITTSMTSAYPEYAGLYAGTTGYWTKDIIATENKYDVGAASPLRPDQMTPAQFTIVNDHVYDKRDEPA
ncbi:MAG TPA: hypothetical protein VGB67_15450, partial [Fibrella sp.]